MTSQSHYATFTEWKHDFIHRALAKGINANSLNSLMSNATLNQRVIELDRSQAEFTKMPWEYVEISRLFKSHQPRQIQIK